MRKTNRAKTISQYSRLVNHHDKPALLRQVDKDGRETFIDIFLMYIYEPLFGANDEPVFTHVRYRTDRKDWYSADCARIEDIWRLPKKQPYRGLQFERYPLNEMLPADQWERIRTNFRAEVVMRKAQTAVASVRVPEASARQKDDRGISTQRTASLH